MIYKSFVIIIMLLVSNYSFSMSEQSDEVQRRLRQLLLNNITNTEILNISMQECDQYIQQTEQQIEKLHATELVKILQHLQDTKAKMNLVKIQRENEMIEVEQALKTQEIIDQNLDTISALDKQLQAKNPSEQNPQQQSLSLQNSAPDRGCHCTIS